MDILPEDILKYFIDSKITFAAFLWTSIFFITSYCFKVNQNTFDVTKTTNDKINDPKNATKIIMILPG